MEKIAHILEGRVELKHEGGTLFALDVYVAPDAERTVCEVWTDTTGWSAADAWRWLGGTESQKLPWKYVA